MHIDWAKPSAWGGFPLLCKERVGRIALFFLKREWSGSPLSFFKAKGFLFLKTMGRIFFIFNKGRRDGSSPLFYTGEYEGIPSFFFKRLIKPSRVARHDMGMHISVDLLQ